MKKLLQFSSLLFFTMTAFAQHPIDAYGYSVNTTKVIPNFAVSTVDTNFVNVDTLHFTPGYSPGAGQFSKDGLEYYISLTIQTGKPHLYVLKRSALKELFGSPQLVAGSINDTAFRSSQPSITADGKTLVFVRNLVDSWTANDLYISTRSDTSLPFDSIRALKGINSIDTAEAYPWISPDGLRLYFSKGNGQSDHLLVSTRQSTNDLFGTPVPLNIEFLGTRTFSCWLSNDEKEIFFSAGQNGDSVMYSYRSNSSAPFTAPVYIWSLSKNGFAAGISAAGDELYLYNVNVIYKNILIYQRILTSIKENNINQPLDFVLNQNYPNPFNPSTTINYSIGKESHANITIYNIIGSKVAIILDEIKTTGSYSVQFNAGNLPSGIYFYTIKTNSIDGKLNFTNTKKMILLK